MSYLLPCAKFNRVTFFMKRSYLLTRENFKLPYLPNQAYWDPGICSQLKSSHIHSIHQKSSDFINGNFVYSSLICAVWSSRGRAGKKVTAVTFFRCPTVIILGVLLYEENGWPGWDSQCYSCWFNGSPTRKYAYLFTNITYCIHISNSINFINRYDISISWVVSICAQHQGGRLNIKMSSY